MRFFCFLFLPLGNMVFIAFSTNEQIVEPGAPNPAEAATYYTPGQGMPVVTRAAGARTQELAMLKPGRKQSTFIDLRNPTPADQWEGYWRWLERPWTWAPTWRTTGGLEAINFPRLFFNTLMIAVIGIVGTLFSCIMVAYGFSRFRFPGRDSAFCADFDGLFACGGYHRADVLFFQVGWVGTWLPLTVPHFFANAYNVFLCASIS